MWQVKGSNADVAGVGRGGPIPGADVAGPNTVRVALDRRELHLSRGIIAVVIINDDRVLVNDGLLLFRLAWPDAVAPESPTAHRHVATQCNTLRRR